MAVSFNQDSDFNKESQFKKVLFGADGKVLEVELNELQDIQNHRMAQYVKLVFGNRPLYAGTYSIANGKLTIQNEYVVVDGDIIFMPSASINVSFGDSVYVNKKDVRIGYDDTVKKYGNVQSSETITNYIWDERINEETTMRIQSTYELTKSNTGEGVFLKLCDIGGSTTTPTVSQLTFEPSTLFKEINSKIESVGTRKTTWDMLEGK